MGLNLADSTDLCRWSSFGYEDVSVNPYLQDLNLMSSFLGGLAEWSIAAVLKTVVPSGTGGSNPSPSANITDSFLKSLLYLIRFCYVFVCLKIHTATIKSSN